jgi:hypothetical protein
VLLFTVVMWEAMVAQRGITANLVPGSNLEWIRRAPLSYHSHRKPAKLIVACRSMGMPRS